MKILNTLPSKLSIGALGLALAAALGLAACGGGGQATGQASAGQATTGSRETLTTQSIDGMTVLVDSQGRALYSPDQERSGKVVCTAGCTAIWQPLAVSGKATAPGALAKDVGTVKRPDGGQQATFDGRPLYTFTQEGPGQLTGDGFKDSFDGTSFTWHAVLASGKTPSASTTTTSPPASSGYGY
jgi:predicted lipoprotein with Yx(FWY)xxD motif